MISGIASEEDRINFRERLAAGHRLQPMARTARHGSKIQS